MGIRHRCLLKSTVFDFNIICNIIARFEDYLKDKTYALWGGQGVNIFSLEHLGIFVLLPV